MNGRIVTYAGRKIRHVAPGHAVDVATGLAITTRLMSGKYCHRWRPQTPGARVDFCSKNLAVVAGHVGRAEATCALVRLMLAIGDRSLDAAAHRPENIG